jgi:hypothetical protein
MRDSKTPVVDDRERRGMGEMVKEAVADAIGQSADKVVVQASRGGGASNESNVEVNIDKVEVHVYGGEE